MAFKYPLSDIDFDETEAQALCEVARSKWLSMGPKTALFEEQFASTLGAKHALALANCTAALHLALIALDVGPDDEVLVPSYTFVASANAILYQRAKPVFVDIVGPDDLNLDPADLEQKITPRAKAIVVVHLAGFPADMDRIAAIAQRHQLPIVEDACHAIGAIYQGGAGSGFRGRQAGAMGTIGCFSFYANKNLPTGEGGMLVTGDDELAERVRLARSHGMTRSSWDKADGKAFDYDIAELGYNYRCTEMTAALGLAQLAKLPDNNVRRRELVRRYRQNLHDTPGVSLPFAHRLEDSAHHIFPLLLEQPEDRQVFRQSLSDRGVQTSVHYPPVHGFTHYRRRESARLPRTEAAAAREVTLPLHPLMSSADVDAICEAVRESLRKIESLK